MAKKKKKSVKMRTSKAKAEDVTDIIQKRIGKIFSRCTMELAEDLKH